jgi:16S rRNA (guanine966-N2)-methyltransferase
MRVIAGNARGRTLTPPRGPETRLTADLIRGAIFSMLEAEALKRGFEVDDEGRFASAVAWPRVVDLFAGSGALGIEALSRGAVQADFVERERAAAEVIRRNLRSLGYEKRAAVHQATVDVGIQRIVGPVGIVFLDPPYSDHLVAQSSLDSLERSDLLTADSVVILEHGAGASEPRVHIGPLSLLRTRTHGRTRVAMYSGAGAV